MKLKYWLLLSAVGTTSGLSIACSSEFSSCESTRTCPRGGAAGKPSDDAMAGEAGSVEAGGSPAASGGTGNAGGKEDVTEGGSGGEAGQASGVPVLFGDCSEEGELACVEHAGAQRLACDGEHWQAATTCAADERCDSSDGQCQPIVAECATAKPGAVVCRGDAILTCGPDLVTASLEKPCEGRCEAGSCKPPTCGDSKVEKGESCDNAADLASGACVKCKVAACGDGILYAGHEQCDDGNLTAGDGCSATCTAEPSDLALGNGITCVRSSTGLVKCWGANGTGALGLGNKNDSGATLPSKLPTIDLGTGRKAVSISTHGTSVCAVLDNGELKCWGNNSTGQLGTGIKNNLGDDLGEMGDLLRAIPLDGAKALAVSAGDSHTCALLTGGKVKCWGYGNWGQLGLDDRIDVLTPQGAPAIQLARPAVAVSASPVIGIGKSLYSGSSCALLDNGTAQCWGFLVPRTSASDLDSSYGVGDYAGEMAAAPSLKFGAADSIKSIIAGSASGAVLDDGSVRLWGSGPQLGQPELGESNLGSSPAELESLAAVPIFPGKKVRSLAVSRTFACATSTDGLLKCWGDGASGQLGLGSTLSTEDQVPSQVPVVNLGTAVSKMDVGDDHACAILVNGKLKCWGNNRYGQLGLGDLRNRGDVEPVLGDDTIVNLTF